MAEMDTQAEQIVSFAMEAVATAEAGKMAILDGLSAPVYATDAEGRITYYNRACIRFSGREPVNGVDRWCVSWKLYAADGREIPHDQCPMAMAIREGRPVRGMKAVAERPDGRKVPFNPYPTPMFDASGALIGAVNLLVDPAQIERARRLRSEAERCKRLARGIDDRSTRDTLNLMAKDYEQRANTLEYI